MSADTRLQRAVTAELNWDPRVPAGYIGVVADAGIITLTDHVENYADKDAAAAAARRVKGVNRAGSCSPAGPARNCASPTAHAAIEAVAETVR